MMQHYRGPVFYFLVACFLLFPLIGGGLTKKAKKIKVACVGDSITFGARLSDRHNHSYPAP